MFKAWFGEGQAEVQDVHHLSQNFPLGEREKKTRHVLRILLT